MERYIIPLLGWAVTLAIYWFDIRPLYHRENEVRPLLLAPLNTLLVALHMQDRTKKELVGVTFTYSIFILLAHLVYQMSGTQFDVWTWTWIVILGCIVAIDVRTTYVPALPLVYTVAFLLLIWQLYINGIEEGAQRFIFAASLYGIFSALAVARRAEEAGTGGGDPPVMLIIGTGFTVPEQAIGFLFIAGGITVIYGAAHLFAMAWCIRKELKEQFQGVRLNDMPYYLAIKLPYLIKQLSGPYITPVPFLPPFCLGAMLTMLLFYG